jgi:hypothetical protein
VTLEASNSAQYQEQGATCQDYIHGNLDGAVQITGDSVALSKPGSYRISYECQDPSGHKAVAVNRQIIVRDSKCPSVSLKGASVVSVEAGFPFKDAGATARDGFDGDISRSITTDGDTVNEAKAYTMSRSCQEIYNQGARKSGMYYIMTTKNTEQKVYCDMKWKKTFKACSKCSRRRDDCSKFGMKKTFPTVGALATFGMKYKIFTNSNYYLCRESGSKFEVPNKSRAHHRINQAEQGKYVISYHVKDAAGNKECKAPFRTVVVRDSLPPVITLHLKNRRITKIAKTSNPATDPKINPFLAYKFMAETSSVNGWIIAAAASAVTGVALLSFSSQKVVAVPV